jgi:hypothetical protein
VRCAGDSGSLAAHRILPWSCSGLLHPPLIRVNGNAGDVHPAALEMHEKQHVVGHQPAQRQHLRGQEVGPSQQRQMDPNESRPLSSRFPCSPRPLPRRKPNSASPTSADIRRRVNWRTGVQAAPSRAASLPAVFNVQTLACGPTGCTASFEKELEQQGALAKENGCLSADPPHQRARAEDAISGSGGRGAHEPKMAFKVLHTDRAE